MWYDIVIGILGAVGGLAGISAFIKSFFFVRQDGEHKTIENLTEIIKEVRVNYNELKGELNSYKKEVDARVALFKDKFDKLEEERNNFYKATMEANRCKLPATINDCPVVKYLNNFETCNDCKLKK